MVGAGPRRPVGRIVVGVDGSPGSLAALRWAVQEASALGMAVRAVTAWEIPARSAHNGSLTAGHFQPVIAAKEILVSALADAGVAADDDTVSTAPVQGHPAEVLMKEAQTAELLVIGSRGFGPIFGALLGSVSQYVAARAACPVVVVSPAGATRAER